MKISITGRKLRELREWMDMTLGCRPARVGLALEKLWRLDNTAYRVLRDGGSAVVRGMALTMKTRALIWHDRILRGEA